MSAEDAMREEILEALRVTGTAQAAVARALGISEKHVSQMMTGKAGISLQMAEELLRACGYRLVIGKKRLPRRRSEQRQ